MIKNFEKYNKSNENNYVSKNENVDYSDIDPYGEEDWNDESKIKEGDTVVCIKSCFSPRGYKIIKDVEYRVIDTACDGNYVSVNGGIQGWWHIGLFKKIQPNNESNKSEILETIDVYEIRKTFNHVPNLQDKNYEDVDFIHSERFLEHIKNLLKNKRIRFKTFNYRTKEGVYLTGIVNGIIYNKSGVLLIFLQNNSGCLDEREPIKIIEKRQIFSEIDPYGEEDWDDDVNENKSRDFKVGDICYWMWDGGRYGIPKGYSKEKCVITATYHEEFKKANILFFKNPHMSFECSLKNLLPEEDFIKKQNSLKLKYIDVDPYGEEDWDNDLNENVKNIKKGDIVTYVGNGLPERRGSRCEVMYVISSIIKAHPDYSRVRFIKDGFSTICLTKYLTHKKYKKIKNIDIDPYDEEDWGYVQESNFYKPLPESCAIEFNTEEEMINICKTLIDMGYKVYNSDRILKGINNNDYCCFVTYGDDDFDFVRSSSRNPSRKIMYTYSDFMSEYGGKKVRKIKRIDIDPYDEEDWGYEEIKENNLYKPLPKSCAIEFNTEEEMINICKTLIDMGYIVYNSEEILKGMNKIRFETAFRFFVTYDDYKFDSDFVRSSARNPHKKVKYTYDDFMNEYGDGAKKFRKIKRIDIDPYDEEDWGYEEIKESNNEIRKVKIIDLLDTMTDDEIVDFLNKNFTNEEIHFYGKDRQIGYERIYNENYLRIPIKYEKVRPFDKYQKKLTEVIRVTFQHENRTNTRELFIDDILVKPSEKKRIYSDIDPYGEEDWDNDMNEINEMNKIKRPSANLFKTDTKKGFNMNFYVGIFFGKFLIKTLISIFKFIDKFKKESDVDYESSEEEDKKLSKIVISVRRLLKFFNSKKIMNLLNELENSKDPKECEVIIEKIKDEYHKRYKENISVQFDFLINISENVFLFNEKFESDIQYIKRLFQKPKLIYYEDIDPYGEENWD